MNFLMVLATVSSFICDILLVSFLAHVFNISLAFLMSLAVDLESVAANSETLSVFIF